MTTTGEPRVTTIPNFETFLRTLNDFTEALELIRDKAQEALDAAAPHDFTLQEYSGMDPEDASWDWDCTHPTCCAGGTSKTQARALAEAEAHRKDPS